MSELLTMLFPCKQQRLPAKKATAKKATEKKATILLGKKSHGKKSHQLGEKSQIMLGNYFAHSIITGICLLYHIVPRVGG